MSEVWTMVVATVPPVGLRRGVYERRRMSESGKSPGERRGISRVTLRRLLTMRPSRSGVVRLIALLVVAVSGGLLALRSRRQAPPASRLTSPARPVVATPVTAPAVDAPAAGAPGVAEAPAAPLAGSHAEQPGSPDQAAAPEPAAPAVPTRVGVHAPSRRSRRRPAQRAALAASLLTLCAVASVMVSGIAPQTFAVVSASSVEDALPPAIATIVEEPPGPDCAVLKCVSLTFDDGPDRYSTPALLDILESRGVKANFFVLGSLIAGNEDIILRMQRLGMGVENHTWNHPDLSALSPAAVTDQLARTNAELHRVLGYTPKYMRPPYGAWTPGYTPTLGMHPVLWEVDPQDWLYRNSATVTQNVVNLVGPGDVILLHDIHQTSVDAVPAIIDSLHERGYTFVTLDDLYATRPGCVVDQYCTQPVPYASVSATTTAPVTVSVSPAPAQPQQ